MTNKRVLYIPPWNNGESPNFSGYFIAIRKLYVTGIQFLEQICDSNSYFSFFMTLILDEESS
jgi:hypothetical protein